MATATLLSFFSLLVLLFCPGSLAQLGYGQGGRRFGAQQGECRIDRLEALEPSQCMQSEAGVTEFFDERNEQFRCAGVTAFRRIVEPRGLVLPSFSNAPGLVYIIQGTGIIGMVLPGCPETFQSSREPEGDRRRRSEREGEGEQGQWSRDEHQRIQHFREGDIIVLPAGVAHWCYNDGDRPVVAITVLDTSNNANQLDQKHRQFMLAGGHRKAGGHQQGRWEHDTSGNSILSGFDAELLAEALGVSREVVRKIQTPEAHRGEIVRVERGLEVLRPWRKEQREEESESESERESERERERVGERERRERDSAAGSWPNGLDESYCSARIKENIGHPSRADIYTPQGGRIATVNNQKLPILNLVQMSAAKLVLFKNAILAPHWNINAHSIAYVTRGRARVQIVGNQGRTVFDDEVRQGQLLVLPQNYAVLTQAQEEGFECVSFRTNGNAMVNEIVGKASTIRGMPEDVLMNSYRISREEARRFKYNRGNQMTIFSPRPHHDRRASYDA